MSVLHPVGPEPPQTYWVRRAVVLGTALVAMIVLIALIVSQNSDGSVVAQGSPSPVAPSPLQSPQASPTPVASDSVSSAVTNAPSPSASTSVSQSASASADPSGRAAAKPSPSTSTSKKSAAKANPESKPSGPIACAPSALRPTLTGDRLLQPKESNTFKLSLINGSGQTCKLAVSGQNFELKIYSGKDRIWSSQDCSTAVKEINQKLSKEEAAAWSITWDGRRSRKDCKSRPEIPKPGTYIATAQFADAKPVRMRMVLHH